MKLVSFKAAGSASYGLWRDDGIVDAGKRFGPSRPTLKSMLAETARLRELAGERVDHALSDVRLLPPVTDPGRILCVGLNYRTHIAETGRETPAFPMLFPRYADSLVGADTPIVRPKNSEKFDYEGELAFAIGCGGRHIERAAALDHVAGYACFNDGSIRDFQRHTSQFLPGKNFWRSGAFGPWLVTPDEVGPIDALELVTRLNGIELQRARLDDLLFGVADLIVYLSSIFPLQPGDVVATGTTGGVGAFRDPPIWMKPGDTVEVSVDRLGTLRNPVADEGLNTSYDRKK